MSGTNDRRPRRRVSEVIDEILDGELPAERREQLLRRVEADPRARAELARTRHTLDMLSEPVETPDLTDAILDRVHARRSFLPERARRRVTVGRMAVAAGLVGAVGIASFAHRHAPAVRLGDGPAPVTRLVEAATPEPGEAASLADEAVERIRASVGPAPARLSLSPRFAPEALFRTDLGLDRAAPPPDPFNTLAFLPRLQAPTASRAIPEGEPDAAAERQLTEAEPSSPLLRRFGPLLGYLREPPGTPEQDAERPR